MTADPGWAAWVKAAGEEVEHLAQSLPPEVRDFAQRLPVLWEKTPEAAGHEGLEPDTLGCFFGAPLGEEPEPGLPAHMVLYLENLWDLAEGDWGEFRAEIGVTYLHELGHYLGLDEDDLGERGLE